MSSATHRRAASGVAQTLFIIATAIFIPTGAARATTINDLNVVGWYGEGVSKTALVVDFAAGSGGSNSFAFGLNYGTAAGGSMTVYDVMDTLKTATAGAPGGGLFDFAATNWGTPENPDYFVDSISYTTSGGTNFSGTNNYDSTQPPLVSWYLWKSSDAGGSWTQSMLGASSETVQDGEIAGWVFAVPDTSGTYDTNPNYWNNTTPPALPVPEPSTLILAAVGVLAALAWRRRQRG